MGLCSKFSMLTLNVMIAVGSRDSSLIVVDALDFWVACILNSLGTVDRHLPLCDLLIFSAGFDYL